MPLRQQSGEFTALLMQRVIVLCELLMLQQYGAASFSEFSRPLYELIAHANNSHKPADTPEMPIGSQG